jgi:hypothetical protein
LFQVFRRAGDADRDIEPRRHRPAGLADLTASGHPAPIDDRVARHQFAAQRRGKIARQIDVRGRADAAPDTDQPLDPGDVDGVGRGHVDGFEPDAGAGLGLPGDLRHPVQTGDPGGREGAGIDQRHRGQAARQFGLGLAAIDLGPGGDAAIAQREVGAGGKQRPAAPRDRRRAPAPSAVPARRRPPGPAR